MKIVFITHYDNPYGANNALYKLIAGMKKNSANEIIVVIPAKGIMSDKLEAIGARCIVSGITQWQAPYVSPLRFFVKKFIRKSRIKKEVDNLYEILKDENIDVIHSNSSVIGHGAMLSMRLGCKHIWHIREFAKEHFGMKYFWSDSFVKSAYEQAERLIVISEALRKNFKFKYPNAKIDRIYDGVSGEYSHDKSEDIYKFIYAGYLYPMKQQHIVVEAVKLLKDRNITNFEVHFSGDGKSDYKDILYKKVQEYSINNIIFDGYVPDIHSHMNKMNAGIIASKYEGFGLVTVEYMLHGLPVIGFNDGGTAEIIENNKTGYLFDSVDELADYMEKLISDRHESEMMGELGKIRAKMFSEEENISNILELYSGLND